MSASVVGARAQRVVIEYHGPAEWFVLFHDGAVRVFASAPAALRAVQRQANQGNRSVTLTTIEWRNAPEGFVPPTPAAK